VHRSDQDRADALDRLSTDVYDELIRRKNAQNPNNEPFLPVQDSFHPCVESLTTRAVVSNHSQEAQREL
jgi:hypothetical protein